MKTVVLNLGRRFKLATCDPIMGSSEVTSEQLFTVNESYTEYEYVYALREMIDTVLLLKRGESMYFQPNRDDPNSKGIIKRIN